MVIIPRWCKAITTLKQPPKNGITLKRIDETTFWVFTISENPIKKIPKEKRIQKSTFIFNS